MLLVRSLSGRSYAKVRRPTRRPGYRQPSPVANRNLRGKQASAPRFTSTTLSFGTIIARHLLRHFKRCLILEPVANQLSMFESAAARISTPTYCDLIKQPDNQKSASGQRS